MGWKPLVGFDPNASAAPEEEYDPFKAFGPGEVKGSPLRPPQNYGLLGNSFGILTPEEQEADLASRFQQFDAGEKRIGQLEGDLAAETAKPVVDPRRAFAKKLTLDQARRDQPDIDELQLMEAGDRPLATKGPIRAGIENTARAVTDTAISIPEFAGIVKGYLQPGQVDDETLLKWTQGAKQYTESLFPGDAARQKDFSQQLASGLGSLATFYAGGGLAALMKAGPKATAAVVAAMGGSASGSQGFEEATRELKAAQAKAAETGDTATVTELDRLIKTLGYAALGTSEAIPIAKTLGRTLEPGSKIGARLSGAAEGAFEESIQEGGQQLGQNIITQKTTDPTRKTFEDVEQNALIGGLLGAGANLLLNTEYEPREGAPTPVDPEGVNPVPKLWRIPDPTTADIKKEFAVDKGEIFEDRPSARPQPAALTEPPRRLTGPEAAPSEATEGAAAPVEMTPERAQLRDAVVKLARATGGKAGTLSAPEITAEFETVGRSEPEITAALDEVKKTGKLSAVANRLLNMFRATPTPGARPTASARPPADVMFAADRSDESGSDADAFGYYSKALREANALRQERGTTEQMLSALRSAGVKENEIQATGLDKFLASKAAPGQNERAMVTKQEIVDYLDQNRTPLQVSKYGGPHSRTGFLQAQLPQMWQRYRNTTDPYEQERLGQLIQQYSDQVAMDAEDTTGEFKQPRWPGYVVDKGNPTYQEEVLNLGVNYHGFRNFLDKMIVKYGDMDIEEMPLDPVERATHRRFDALADTEDFRSGHWAEPNAVAHMRTQQLRTQDGRIALNLDELQSDWGQQLRERGERNEERAKELREHFEQMVKVSSSPLARAYRAAQAYDKANGHDTNYADEAMESGRMMSGDSMMMSDYYGFERALQKALYDDFPDFRRAMDRLKDARMASADAHDGYLDQGAAEEELSDLYERYTRDDPLYLAFSEAQNAKGRGLTGNPLIRTTDQWVTTALNRLLTRAVEEGVDGISITPGVMQARRWGQLKEVGVLRVASQLGEGALEIYMYTPEMVAGAGWFHMMPDGRIADVNNQSLAQAWEGKTVADIFGPQVAAELMRGRLGDNIKLADPIEFGGQGMQATYDNIYPRALTKMLQKMDKTIKPERQHMRPLEDATADPKARWEPFYFVELTDKVREKVANEQLPMFARDRAAEEEQNYETDALGFYSKALEEARRLRQNKGTTEQMLSALKTAGVKEAEIQATGLDKLFAAKSAPGQNARPSITKQEIVDHLEKNRVRLKEIVLGGHNNEALAKRRELNEQMRAVGDRLYHPGTFAELPDADPADRAEYDRLLREMSRLDRAIAPVKYRRYSVDQNNPTYQERLVQIRDLRREEIKDRIYEINQEIDNKYFDGTWGDTLTPEQTAAKSALTKEKLALLQEESELRGEFTSGHWEGAADIMAHIRTQELKTSEGERVLNLDELQSDWGQKIRDLGGQDEQKIARLRTAFDEAAARDREAAITLDNAMVALEDTLPERMDSLDRRAIQTHLNRVRYEGPGFGSTLRGEAGDYMLRVLGRSWRNAAKREELNQAHANYEAVHSEFELRQAEMRTAMSGVVTHPLVRNTDQWVTTALRRFLNDAAQRDVDGITITPGREQNIRYRLSAHFDRVVVTTVNPADGTRDVSVYRPGDGEHASITMTVDQFGTVRSTEPPYLTHLHNQHLRDIVGDAPTEAIMAVPADARRDMRMDDLEVGGNGMKATYDEMYPKTMLKILRKYDPSIKPQTRNVNGHTGAPVENGVIYIPLTPLAKTGLLSQPMFAVGAQLSEPELESLRGIAGEALQSWHGQLAEALGSQFPGRDQANRAIQAMVDGRGSNRDHLAAAMRGEGFGTVPAELLDQGLMIAQMVQGVDNADRFYAIDGFYSSAMRAIEQARQERATPEQWKALLKGPGISQNEVSWMGLMEWLDEQASMMVDRPGSNAPRSEKTLTRDQILDFIRSHQMQLTTSLLRSEESRRPSKVQEENEAEPDEYAHFDRQTVEQEREEWINEREIEIYDELRDEWVSEQMSEWEDRNDPKQYEIEVTVDLEEDGPDGPAAQYAEAERKLRAARESWRREEWRNQLALPGFEDMVTPPYPEIRQFLPKEFFDENPGGFSYTLVHKVGADIEGDYYDTREEAEDAAEAQKDELIEDYDRNLEREQQSLYEQDHHEFWGDARRQAQEEWADQNPEEAEFLESQDEGGGGRGRIANQTQFQRYAIKGGREYSELLVKMPYLKTQGYSSGHYRQDELVHVRFDFRTGGDGQRVMFIHEIQSDLHQRARKAGYRPRNYQEVKEQYETARKAYDAALDKVTNDVLIPKLLAGQEFESLAGSQYGSYKVTSHVNPETQGSSYIGHVPAHGTRVFSSVEMAASHVAQMMVSMQSRLIHDLDDNLQQLFDRQLELHKRTLAPYPDAPYKGNLWWELGFKAALQHAVDEEAAGIALTLPHEIRQATMTPAAVAQKFYGENVPKFVDKYMKQWGVKREQTGLSGTEMTTKYRFAADGEVTPQTALDYFRRRRQEMSGDHFADQRDLLIQALEEMAQDPTVTQQQLLNVLTSNAYSSYYGPMGWYNPTGTFVDELLDRYEAQVDHPYWPFNDKLRDALTDRGKGQAMAADSAADAFKAYARARVKLGLSTEINAGDVKTIFDTVLPQAAMLPDGMQIRVLTRLVPVAGEPNRVMGYFADSKGNIVSQEWSVADMFSMRAFFDGGRFSGQPGVFFINFGLGGEFTHRLRGELRHEGIHALRGRQLLGGEAWERLLSHANDLGVLNITQNDYLDMIGKTGKRTADGDVNLGAIYHQLYKDRPELYAEAMEQEAVAHLAELYSHGILTQEQSAPIAALLDSIFRGDYADYAPGAMHNDMRPSTGARALDVALPIDGGQSRILRQESATLRSDGKVFAGRPSRKGGESVLSARDAAAAQKAEAIEPISLPGQSGYVMAHKPYPGYIGRLTYASFPAGTTAHGMRNIQSKATAYADLNQHPDGSWEIGYVQANPNMQKRGYARKLYAAIEADLGIRIAPSGQLSSQGYAFWQKRSPASVQWHRQLHEGAEVEWVSPRYLKQRIRMLDQEIRALQTIQDRTGPEEADLIDAKKQRAKAQGLLFQLPKDARQASDTMFAWGGPNAEIADLSMLQLAKEMAARKVPPETIWEQTGWYDGGEGEWLFEIDDSKMRLKFSQAPEFSSTRAASLYNSIMWQATKADPEGVQAVAQAEYDRIFGLRPRDADEEEKAEILRAIQNYRQGLIVENYKDPFDGSPIQVLRFNGYLEDLIDHPQLFQAYPRLRKLRVAFTSNLDASTRGGVGIGGIQIASRLPTLDDMQETLIHEIQHVVQVIEGYSSGGNVNSYASRLSMAMFEIQQQMKELRPDSNMMPLLREMREEIADRMAFLGENRSGMGLGGEQLEGYERIRGEAKARSASARRLLDAPTRQATFPAKSEDVLPEEQYDARRLMSVRPKNFKLIQEMVKEATRDWPSMVRDVQEYGDKVVTNYYSISLNPLYRGVNNPKPIKGQRGNISLSLDFTPEDIADKIIQFGIDNLRAHIQEHMDYSVKGPYEKVSEDSDETRPMFPNWQRAKGSEGRLQLLLDLLDNMAAVRPDLKAKQSYETAPIDREGVLEPYKGKIYTIREYDRLMRKVQELIIRLGQAGKLDMGEAENAVADMESHGAYILDTTAEYSKANYDIIYNADPALIDEFRFAEATRVFKQARDNAMVEVDPFVPGGPLKRRPLTPEEMEDEFSEEDFLAPGLDNMRTLIGGRKAQGADLTELARAEAQEKQGQSPKEIWTDTGWLRGLDGEWRFEIDDRKLKIKIPFEELRRGTKYQRLADVIDHPELFKHYPKAKDILVQFKARWPAPEASFMPDIKIGRLWKWLTGSASSKPYIQVGVGGLREPADVEVVRSALAHEIQHLIQRIENFGRGGNPTSEARAVAERLLKGEETERDKAIMSLDDELSNLWANIIQQRLIIAREEAKGDPKRYLGLLGAQRFEQAPERTGRDHLVIKAAKDKIKVLADELSRPLGLYLYQSIAGEMEAREVQARLDETDPVYARDMPDLKRGLPDTLIGVAPQEGLADFLAGSPAMAPYEQGLRRAAQLEKANVSPDVIARQTGWRRDDDGQWQFSLNPTAAKNLGLAVAVN